MNLYYRMTTAQKDSVAPDLLEGVPKPNLSGDEWIIEANVSGLEAIQEFPSPQECINYIVQNNPLWDEFYDI